MPLAEIMPARAARTGQPARKPKPANESPFDMRASSDMSVVGPRPERPAFYGKLDRAVPYFADRTIELQPGVTGLAQVRQGYDTSIDDVRRKVGMRCGIRDSPDLAAELDRHRPRHHGPDGCRDVYRPRPVRQDQGREALGTHYFGC
jgi:hypothetical protein